MAIFKNFQPQDIYQCRGSETIKERADCVGVICIEGQGFLTKNGFQTKSMAHWKDYGRARYPDMLPGPLCKEIRELPAVWMVGTAFMIGRRTALTAWHNVDLLLNEIDGATVGNLRLVFGYYLRSSALSSARFEIYNVTHAEQVQDPDPNRQLPSDVGILSLATSRANFLDCAKKTMIQNLQGGAEIEMLGYPYGQMLKYTKGNIIGVSNYSTLKATVTGFPGNSGSPVFVNGEVVGVYNSAHGADVILQGDCVKYGHGTTNDYASVRTLEILYDAGDLKA
jgi:hypothetical protein